MGKRLTWPPRPDHITNDGSVQPEISPLRKLSGLGIIPNWSLRGLQTSICVNIHNPTTMIEFPSNVKFSPDMMISLEQDSSSVRTVRTDSTLLPFELRPACSLFRKHTDCKYCYAYDDVHALLFQGLEKSNIADEIKKRIESSKFIKQIYSDKSLYPKFVQKHGCGYLEFDCQLLGYRELVLPVFFNDRVIAVFYFGAIILDDKTDYIKQKQEDFLLLEYDNIISCLTSGQQNSKDVIDNILNAHEEWIRDTSHILSQSDYDEVIKNACNELDGLEKTLDDQMELQREEYIREHIDQRIQDFQDKLPKTLSNNEKDILDLWDNLRVRLEDLIEDFAMKYVIVFGTKRFTQERLPILVAVATVGGLPEDIKSKISAFGYDIEKIPADALIHYTDSRQCPDLFLGLCNSKDLFNHENTLIRIFPVPFFEQRSTVVLVGYHDWNSLYSVENKSNGYLDSSIQLFYNSVLFSLSSILAATAQFYMNTNLRILGHELGQLTSGLDWLRVLYLSNPDILKNLSNDKVNDLQRDIEGFVKQVYLLSDKAGKLISMPDPNKELFWAFRELLFKWKDTYRLETEKKKLQFYLITTSSTDPYRPMIYGDQMLLEQMVYNLVNNAVKYCYRGTKIRLDCSKKGLNKESPYILTVVNYGIEIEDGDKIYEMYYRGSNTERESGLGLGLYIAKQIALAHGGNIKHFRKKISEFNVPLIEPYLRSNELQQDLEIIRSLEDELDQLQNIRKYYEIIAQDEKHILKYSEPTLDEMKNSINKPTWEVTFEVTIPAKGD